MQTQINEFACGISAMKTTKILYKEVLQKIFGSAKHELYAKLFSIFSQTASEKDYLENLTSHSDAIHWHLNRVNILDFEKILREYFKHFLKYLRKSVHWQKITIAFDETYIPFYGKPIDNWVVGYNNKVKGATGSYKFMACSIIVANKRYVIGIMPMHNCQDSTHIIDQMLNIIRSKFRIETVLFDRGFCTKKLCRELEMKNLKYLILAPRWKNISRYLKEEQVEIIEKTRIREKKTQTDFNWRFVFAYNEYGYDWAFATNLQDTPANLVKLYKCRWGIETNFRVMDFADIKSKSKNVVTRCFFFLISAFLFNSWLEFDKNMTFESYLDSLAYSQITLSNLLEKWKKSKELFGVSISDSEQKILSSFALMRRFYPSFPVGYMPKSACKQSANFVISLQGISAQVI